MIIIMKIIYELVHDTNNKVTLFTRPRRFGKTLMMSMMENFFSIRKDSKDMFEGLVITDHEEFCREWMNQYPVLFISFKDIEAEDFEGAYKMLESRLADVCKDLLPCIENNESVNSADMEIFHRLMYGNGQENEVKNSLKTLMRMLNAVYGKKVILLINEYDVPLAKANFKIAKESIFTGTNNFASYSVIDERFSGYFGFREEEVNQMLDLADRKDAAPEMKEWYDGYVFGSSYVYCPWDVINHISALKYKKNAAPKNYWKNTSHNGILLTFVRHTDFDVADKFETLLNGGTRLSCGVQQGKRAWQTGHPSQR